MGKIDAGKVRDLWKKGQDEVAGLVTNYAINSAFAYGDQWIKAESPTSTNLVQVARDADRVRVTVNRVGPALRSLAAKLHKRPLVWEVPAPGADDVSAQKARRAEAVVASTAEQQDWEHIRAEGDWMTLLGGTAVLWSDWDPSAGTFLKEDDRGNQVGTGDVVVHVSSIAEVAIEPGSRDARTARWAIRGVAMPPEQVQDTYKLKKVPQADSAGIIGQFGTTDLTRQSNAKSPDLTMVFHYYRRPSRLDPKGEMAVIVGNEVVQTADWPFPFADHLPLVVQRETMISRKWMGDTLVTSAVPIQTAYNQAWSSLLEHTKLCGNARGFIPEGTVDLLDDLTDLPGEWHSYQSGPDGGVPTYLSPPQLPQWVIDQPSMLRRELDDILGQQEISRGQAPSNVESGLGLSILAEQADTPITQLAVESARAWSKVASDCLALYARYVTETRTADVAIPGRSIEGTKWKGTDLEGVETARVPYDAVLPKSRAAQQALAMELWEKKIVTDPEKIAEIGDLPDKESFIAALNDDVAKAHRENFDIADGEKGFLQPFDSHADHIRVHNSFRKSKKYQMLDPAGQKRFDDHVAAHEAAAQADQVSAAAATAMSPTGETPPLASEADIAQLASLVPPGADQAPEMPGLGDAGPMSAEGLT